MAKKAQPAARPSLIVVDALMALAAERGWLAVSLADIAERAGLSLADLHDQYPSKSAILAAYRESLDVAVLRGDPLDREASSRDRLFDVVMRRFDAMQPHRDGIRAVLRDSMVDPWTLLCVRHRTPASREQRDRFSECPPNLKRHAWVGFQGGSSSSERRLLVDIKPGSEFDELIP